MPPSDDLDMRDAIPAYFFKGRRQQQHNSAGSSPPALKHQSQNRGNNPPTPDPSVTPGQRECPIWITDDSDIENGGNGGNTNDNDEESEEVQVLEEGVVKLNIVLRPPPSLQPVGCVYRIHPNHPRQARIRRVRSARQRGDSIRHAHRARHARQRDTQSTPRTLLDHVRPTCSERTTKGRTYKQTPFHLGMVNLHPYPRLPRLSSEHKTRDQRS